MHQIDAILIGAATIQERPLMVRVRYSKVYCSYVLCKIVISVPFTSELSGGGFHPCQVGSMNCGRQ